MGSTTASTSRWRGHAPYRALLPAILTADPDVDGGAAVRRSTRDWIIDVLCVLTAFGIGALAFVGAREGEEPFSEAVHGLDLAAGILACFAVWLRRRWPVGLALALAPLATFSAMSGGATTIALFTVAVHRRFPMVAAVTAIYLATVPVYGMIVSSTELFWTELVIGVLLTLVVVAWGTVIRARRQLVLSLRERAQRAEGEQQLRVEQARHAERERIAREMHDVLAHRISLLSLHAGALEFRPDAPPEEVAKAAGVIRDSAHQALEDLREVIGVLRGDGGGEVAPARPQPTLADVPELVEESRQAGMRVELVDRLDDPEAAPASVGRNAYRIVQEGLTNARKHAPGAVVTVRLDGAAGSGLRIEIRNPRAVGMADPEIPGAGAGLVGLAERVSLAGGELHHDRTLTGEFRLSVWLPWPA